MTMLTRPLPLLRALSLTPPEPKPCTDTLSALESRALVGGGFEELLFVRLKVLAVLTPAISSKVVGGVRVPPEVGEVALGSSLFKDPPDAEGSTGNDMRCSSFWLAGTGDSSRDVVAI